MNMKKLWHREYLYINVYDIGDGVVLFELNWYAQTLDLYDRSIFLMWSIRRVNQ